MSLSNKSVGGDWEWALPSLGQLQTTISYFPIKEEVSVNELMCVGINAG